MKIDVLIACYNEASRIGGVLQVLDNSPLINQVIVVDDGSSDRSVEIANSYKKTTVAELQTNRGKGQALRAGIKLITTEDVFLCDADLTGLSSQIIEQLISTYEQYQPCLVVGLRQKNLILLNPWLRKNVLPLIAGERILKVEHLEKILNHPFSDKYGIEVLMNYFFSTKKIPIIKIFMSGVNHVQKWNKEQSGWIDLAWETYNVASRLILIHAQSPRF